VQQIPYLNRHNNVKGIHFNMAKFSSEQPSIIQSQFPYTDKSYSRTFHGLTRPNFIFKDFQGLEIAAFQFKELRRCGGHPGHSVQYGRAKIHRTSQTTKKWTEENNKWQVERAETNWSKQYQQKSHNSASEERHRLPSLHTHTNCNSTSLSNAAQH